MLELEERESRADVENQVQSGERDISQQRVSSSSSEEDPWAISTLYVRTIPWQELTLAEKFRRLLLTYILRPISLLILFYLFLCSLDLLDSSLRLIGGRLATGIFKDRAHFTNPVSVAMMGLLVTVLVQSSSTATAVAAAVVGAGLMEVKTAIFFIMGCNIGTTETNTLVSLTQSADKNQFRRAFAGAAIHDVFNWLSFLVILPLEWATGFLNKLSNAIVQGSHIKTVNGADQWFRKEIVKPVTKYIITVDTDRFQEIASNSTSLEISLIKIDCDQGNTTFPCKFMFMSVAGVWKDWQVGLILLLLTIALLCTCLCFTVKLLNAIFSGYFAIRFKKFVNSDFPGCAKHLTGYIAILAGSMVTALLTSSSVFTSALTPLAGVGVVTIDRMYPLIIGANIGTTFSAIFSTLGHDSLIIKNVVQVSLCHLFFNLTGFLLWYPIPCMRRLPLFMAKKLGNTAAEYRWFSGLFIIFTYYAFPLAILGLTCASVWVLGAALIIILLTVSAVVIVNIIQNKKPQFLPKTLQNWDFLPTFCHSLKPFDDIISKVLAKLCFLCRKMAQK